MFHHCGALVLGTVPNLPQGDPYYVGKLQGYILMLIQLIFYRGQKTGQKVFMAWGQ